MTPELAFALYFMYGLAFFSLGMALLLESWRLPADAPQADLIRPLAAFGLLHGAHEWVEAYFLEQVRLGQPATLAGSWLRVGLLAASFVALLLYSYHAIRYARGHLSPLTVFGMITLPLFALLVTSDLVASFLAGGITPLRFAETLARSLLGVPAAAISALGLMAAAQKARADHRQPLDRSLTLAGIGFAAYSLTQLVVAPIPSVLGSRINTEVFFAAVGIPIQVFRTLSAIVIATGLIGATRFLEQERRAVEAEAQAARLRALERNEALQRDLLHHTVRAQEMERARVARELHDEAAQLLTALTLDLATLERALDRQPQARPMLDHLRELSHRLARGLDRIVLDLRPALLDRLGLVPALEALTGSMSVRLGHAVNLEVEGCPRRLEPEVETTLYRIAQEALTNIARHAGASQADIRLAFAHDSIALSVSDNGAGFETPEATHALAGWGLVGMRERAESVGGHLRIESTPGMGTQILLRLPAPALPESTA